MDAKLKEIFSSFEGKPEELIPLLQQAQASFGFLSKEALAEIAKFARVSESNAYGVATFYTQFRFSPIGKKHIMVCRGTACHVRGAPTILSEIKKQLNIDEGETTQDGSYSLETVACIGCCGLAPCVMVNQKVEANLTPKKVAEMFAKSEKK